MILQYFILIISLTCLQLVKSDCEQSSACDTACLDSGYYTTDSSECTKPTSNVCYSKTGISLCSNSSKLCMSEYGFITNSDDCDFPSDCSSDSVACSTACNLISYTGTSNCKSQDDSYCQNSTNTSCIYSQSVCITERGWVQGTNGVCNIPDCTASNACNKSACIYIGYNLDASTGSCNIPSIGDCLVVNSSKCILPESPCINSQKLEIGVGNDCQLPTTDCFSTSQKCTPACEYLNYVSYLNTCEYPTHSFCLTVGQKYCTNSLSACMKLGWISKDASNKDCAAPDCLSNCGSDACNYLGYKNDNGVCSVKLYEKCLLTGIDLCSSDGQSACLEIGFEQKGITKDCVYPTDCLSTSTVCSKICLTFYYVSGVNKCELPTDQSICLNGSGDQCTSKLSACSVLGWSQKSGSNACELPDCLSSIQQCSMSVCTYLGYDQNTDLSCKQPSIDDCLEIGKQRCAHSYKLCNSFGYIKSQTSNDCDIPNCLQDVLTCDSAICQHLKYIKDGTSCILPTFDECQELSKDHCLVKNKSACFQKGFVQQNGSSDCYFPSDCLSNLNACSDICQYLNYNTNASTCGYKDYQFCLTLNSNNCSIPQKSCSVYGWQKDTLSDSCIQPDCENSSVSCQTNACPLLQFIRQADKSCKVPTIDECLESGKGRCTNPYSQCIITLGLVKQANNDCILPTDCLQQSDCSTACLYQGYLKDVSKVCKLPTHQDCLVTGLSQCSLQLKMCSQMGWTKSIDGLSCINPDCAADPTQCAKAACTFLGYIKQLDNTCRVPTADECRLTGQNYCLENQKFCVDNYKFVKSVSGDCNLPTDCETRSDKCPVSCNYIGYVNDSTPQQLCSKPTNDNCQNVSNIYLCRQSVVFCTDQGWIKSKTAGSNFCILPTCLSGQRCGSGLNSNACKYSGYVKSQNNDSCVEPTNQQCLSVPSLCLNSNTVCIKNGWENDGNGNCRLPSDCTIVNGSHCAVGKTACSLFGYVKNSANDDCILPTFEHCNDKKNFYLCSDDVLYCTGIGFIKTSEVGKSYCEIPTDCETNSLRCQAGKIACLVKGYVKDKLTDKCIKPIDEDCNNSANLYACFDPSSFCSIQNWKQSASPGSYTCQPPSDCLVNNQCQFQYSACQYIGYVNDYSINNCIVPTNSHCQNQVFNHLCRPGVTFCTSMGYKIQPNSNKCGIPDCLNGQYCQAGSSACTYNGYLALQDGNCHKPTNDDCFNSSSSINNQLCRSDISFCTSKGYKRSIANLSDNYCVTPTDCNNSQQCALGLTACITLGYQKGINNDTCYEPTDFDCYNSTANPDLCKNGVTFCTGKGWVKPALYNFCVKPTNCTTGNQCVSGKTACLFFGYVPDINGKCVLPQDADCANQANVYLCRNENVYCTKYGWQKENNINLNYCVPPSQDDCLKFPYCSSTLKACKYIGFVNNGIDDGCMKPLDDHCLNSSTYPQLCRPDIFFCTGLGYIKDSTTYKCIPPTDCLGNLKCGGNGNTACMFTGYIPVAPNDTTCKKPVMSDCAIITNKYLCRDPSQDCVKNFNYEQTSNVGQSYCELPKACLTGSQCFSGSACFSIGFVQKPSTTKCKIPSDSDCFDSKNKLACYTNDYCQKKGWIKTSDPTQSFCVAPTDCLSGNQCSATLSACKYLGYVKKSVNSDQCSIPTDDQCLNPAINATLCREGVGFCSDRGWVKSSTNDSCEEPADCLLGEQCGMGKICLFLGYVAQQGSNKCKQPDDDDCNNTNNIYACRTGNTFCTSRGWKKTSDPNLNYCVPDVDCLSGDQCDPSLFLCRFLGYVQIPTTNNCRIPTDIDCADQSNDIACRGATSFCVAKGWLKAPKLSDKFCVSPQCLDGGNYCSPSQTACKYQGYVKKTLDDTCKIPGDEDCILKANNLCAININFCIDKGYFKVADPTQNFCVLPQDCTTGQQCSQQLSACRVIGGYVQGQTGYKCVPPDDSDCMNIQNTLCRSGVDMCTSRGFIKSTSRQTDLFCILPDCLGVQDLCSPKLSACIFGGFLKNPGNNSCFAPSDDDCANQSNSFLCRVGNPICPSRGWIKNNSNPLEKSCISPNNCLISKIMCGDSLTACTYSGYVKDPSSSQCLLPSIEQCLDQSLNMCRTPQSPCIAIKGYKKAQSGNYCVYPDNCLTGIQCYSNQIACKQLGFIKTSDKLFKCINPTDDQCLQQPLCYSDQSQCIKMGYSRVSADTCIKPVNCLSGQQCGPTQTACFLQNYIKSTTDNSCVIPHFQDCLNNTQPNLCQGDNQFCKNLGFILDSKTGKCMIDPMYCADSEFKLCSDDITFCTQLGWIKSSAEGQCKAPDSCQTGTQCISEESACSIIGYASTLQGSCILPQDCKIGNLCSKYKTICIQKGYTKKSTDDNCICSTSNEQNGSCSAENVQQVLQSFSIKLTFQLFTSIIVLIILF